MDVKQDAPKTRKPKMHFVNSKCKIPVSHLIRTVPIGEVSAFNIVVILTSFSFFISEGKVHVKVQCITYFSHSIFGRNKGFISSLNVPGWL
jgi:hypothetical protein